MSRLGWGFGVRFWAQRKEEKKRRKKKEKKKQKMKENGKEKQTTRKGTASDLRPPTSDLGPPASSLRPPTSDLRMESIAKLGLRERRDGTPEDLWRHFSTHGQEAEKYQNEDEANKVRNGLETHCVTKRSVFSEKKLAEKIEAVRSNKWKTQFPGSWHGTPNRDTPRQGTV